MNAGAVLGSQASSPAHVCQFCAGGAGHADRFWALALALHAVGRDTGPTVILPAVSGAGVGLPGFGDGYRRPDHSGDYMTRGVI